MPRTIAIVEDEEDIRANYTELFRRQGYRVDGYASRREALAGFSSRLPDLAILDIGLGEEFDGGFELCRELRSLSPMLPIIFLSARDSDIDMVSGLRLGADDYLTKDISLPHLSARVAALFRRVDAMRGGMQENQLQQGELALDMDRLSARWKGQDVELTVTELWMLHALALHPGHVKSREQLMQAANIVVEAATITSHIRRMRGRFLELDPAFEQIESVYGIGYRWKESGQG
ncbi:proteobacterial dedicated sortase system response regulator [Thiolapillus sp.]